MKKVLEIIKENKGKSTIVAVLVLVLVVSFSYAAFFKSASGTSKTGSIGTLNVSYVDGESINVSSAIPLTDDEVLEFAASHTFSVQNTGSVTAYTEISLGNIVIDSALKNSSDFRWAIYEGNTQISTGNFMTASSTLPLMKNLVITSGQTKTYTLRLWINDNGGNQNSLLNKNLAGKIVVSATDTVVATTINYSGTIQTYTVPKTGQYYIEAAGASGGYGNMFSLNSAPAKGGKGASIKAAFNLNQNDILTIVVGGKGSSIQGTAKDGASGPGGGGSFVFKKITSITNSNYQITKGSTNYEVLLVAAGGGGTNDSSYQSSATAGSDGIGATWYSPSNYVAYSQATATTSSASLSSVLGIKQFITYDSAGGTYTRNSSVCKGGFGGGGCADDSKSYGGGWSGSNYAASSFSSGSNTTGITGDRTGNGYVTITPVSN